MLVDLHAVCFVRATSHRYCGAHAVVVRCCRRRCALSLSSCRAHRRCHAVACLHRAAPLPLTMPLGVRTIVVIAPLGVCTTPSSSPLQCTVVVVVSSLSRAIDIVRLCTMPGPCSLVDDGRGGAGGALRSLSWSCTIEVAGWHVSIGNGDRRHAFVHDTRAFGPDGGWYRGVLLVPSDRRWLGGTLVAAVGDGGTDGLSEGHRALVHNARAHAPDWQGVCGVLVMPSYCCRGRGPSRSSVGGGARALGMGRSVLCFCAQRLGPSTHWTGEGGWCAWCASITVVGWRAGRNRWWWWRGGLEWMASCACAQCQGPRTRLTVCGGCWWCLPLVSVVVAARRCGRWWVATWRW